MYQPDFLRDVAQYFATGAAGRPVHEDVVYVLPNKRGAMFLKEEIHKTMTRAGRMPRLMTMRGFLSNLSGFPEAPERTQLFMLYDAYRRVMRRHGAGQSLRSFDSFVFWGDMIVSDFDEIDRSMISADSIFCNLKRVKEIQADYLNEDQKETVRRIWGESRLTGHTEQFWLHVNNEDNDSSLAHKFVSLWGILAEVYTEFKTILRSKGMISAGDSYRMAVDAVNALDPQNLPPHTHYAFVGFNDACVAETLIFNRLRRLGIASFFWDSAVTDLFGDAAGRPLKRLMQLIRAFPAPADFKTKGLQAKDITVDIYAVPSEMAQAKCAGDSILQWVKAGYADGDNSINTAVILPDQSLLLPLVFSIPEDIRKFNVSMGLPYRSTTFAALLQNIISMQLRARRIRGSYHFYFEDVAAVLAHPHMRYIDPEASDKVLASIKSKKLFNIDAAALAEEFPVFKAVFTPVHDLKNVDAVSQYLGDLFRWLSESLSRSPHGNDITPAAHAGQFENKVLDYLAKTVESLSALAKEYSIEMADRTFLRLFERMLNHSDVPASGTPLAGLQVLGVLETRTLDFENIAILSLNERIFPRRQYTHTMIPGTLRAGYGLPEYDSLESTYAYCFFRLVSRARRLALYYDSRFNNDGTGEMSRYLNQLMYLVPGLKVNHHSINPGGANGSVLPICVKKTPQVMEHINRMRAGGDLYLSASALKTFKKCPLAFYLKYIRNLRDDDEVVDYMNSADHGTIVHNVIQRAFASFGNSQITAQGLTAITDKNNNLLYRLALQEVVLQKYRQYTDKPETMPTEGVIAADIIAEICRMELIAERDSYCQGNNSFRFVEAEMKVRGPWRINDNLSINWYMSIDRVDDTGNGLRFVDFKTGADKNSSDKWESLFDCDHKKDGIFQILTYCEAYRAMIAPDAPIYPVLHITRQITKTLGITKLSVERKVIENYGDEESQKMQPLLNALISQIFDPDKPFGQCTDTDNCKLCIFNDICGRCTSAKDTY